MKFKIAISHKVNKDGTSPLFLRYYFHSKKYTLPVDLRIESVFFNAEKEEVKKIHPRAAEYNMLINKAKADANDVLIRAKLEGVQITPNLIESEFKNPSSVQEFYPWVVNEIIRKDLAPGSRSAYNAIMNKLNEYAPSIRFAEMDDIFLHKWDAWMKKYKQNDMDTRANAHKRLKTFLKVAHQRRLIGKNPYDAFPIKRSNQPSKRVYLTFSERADLVELYENGALSHSDKKVLRGFLFSCFTGLRFSDMIRVKKSFVMDNMLVFTPLKQARTTQILIKVPLVPYAQKLIQDSNINIYGAYFKHLSEQKTNEAIKRIVMKVKIKKHITTHVARHTFATLFWETTKDIASLQKLLGHSDIKQTMIYAHVSDEILKDQMTKFGAK
jgi:site-specific recombinase XerD